MTATLAFNPATAITSFTDADAHTRIYNPLTGGTFYALVVDGTVAATITYQTDLYSCPFSVGTDVDLHLTFEGCGFRTLTSNYFQTSDSPVYANTYPRHALLNIGLREVL